MPRVLSPREFRDTIDVYASSLNLNNDQIQALYILNGIESRSGTATEYSYKNTSPARIRKAFGARSKIAQLSDEEINELKKDDEKFFNFVYAGKIGNGDANSGDGYKYRGRGGIQLTGRSNYAKLTKVLNEKMGIDIDLVENPELAADPRYSAAVLVAYSEQRGMFDPDHDRYISQDTLAILKKGDTDSAEYKKAIDDLHEITNPRAGNEHLTKQAVIVYEDVDNQYAVSDTTNGARILTEINAVLPANYNTENLDDTYVIDYDTGEPIQVDGKNVDAISEKGQELIADGTGYSETKSQYEARKETEPGITADRELKKPRRHQFRTINEYNKAKKEYEEALKKREEKEKEEEKEEEEVIAAETEEVVEETEEVVEEPQYQIVLDAEGNEVRIPVGESTTEEQIERERQTEETGVKTYENWTQVYEDDSLSRGETIQVGPNKYKWQPDEGAAEGDENAGKYLIVDEQGEFVPYENNEIQLIAQTELRNQVLGTSDEVEEEVTEEGIVIKEEVSRVDNGDGTTTINYADGTSEIITTPVVETSDVVDTTDVTTDEEGPNLMEKIGSGVGATLKGAGTLLDSIGGPGAIVSYIMGKEGLKHAMKEIEPQKMPELSPLFHQHLRQTKELAKKGFHPAEARKIRNEIDAAYEQGLDNAVRGTSGDRAKFLAQSGILDSKRSSALLDFAAQDAALQRENQDRYVDTMMFKENFEAQRSEKLRAEDMQMQMANKQSAAQFTSAAFSNLMSGLGGSNTALIRQLLNAYQGGGTGTTNMFNTVNP
tara:strand:+ start:1317 stop:3644 length:2328 start_codon:yes stop_codon:yes gene_type:complete